MNMLEARIERENGGLAAIARRDAAWRSTSEALARHPALAAYDGRTVVLGIRPEDLEDAALANGDGDRGSAARSSCARRSARRCSSTSRSPRRRRSPTTCASSPRTSATTARSASSPQGAARRGDARRAASARGRGSAEGETVEVVVDQRALHFFDSAHRARDPRRSRSGLTSPEDQPVDAFNATTRACVDKDRMFMPK